MACSSITEWQIEWDNEVVTDILLPKSLRTVTAAMKSEYDCFLAGKR